MQSSTLLKRVNGDEWEDVPNQFNRCVFAGGRKLPGLIRQRAVEAALWAQNL
ncbi:MAG: glycoside hydrolase family protein [Alphaproteobacteria bacterium]